MHAHDHQVDYGRAFAVGVTLNTVFVIIEAVYGLMSGSLALIADAGHNLGDVLALLLAWGAVVLSRRSPSQRRTYGLRRATILAALGSSMLMIMTVLIIVWEALRRLGDPAPVDGKTVMIVAAIGVVINTITALMFHRGRHNDLNIRSAWLHMAADAAVSLGVVLAGLLIVYTGRIWLDPLISVVIAVIILAATWQLLRESVDMAVDAVPKNIDPEAVRQFLLSLPGVEAVHDLHIWSMSTTETALTAHLVMPGGAQDQLLHETSNSLLTRFNIHHATLQVERGDPGTTCDVCMPVTTELTH